MSKTKIEWCDETWNPITGCTPISDGCKNCYAAKMANRLKNNPKTQKKYRNGFEVTFHRNELNREFKGKGKRIFVCSMGDIFHADVNPLWIDYIIEKIRMTPQHTFLMLTKRTCIMSRYFEIIKAPKNLWLGVTIENQASTIRLTEFADIPAPVKFISIEPMLEPITIKDHKTISAIDWVICGAETGPKARQMKPHWAYSLQEECKNLKIPFFFKKFSKGETKGEDMNREFPKQKDK